MHRRLLFSALLFVSTPAVASDTNLSGRYEDVKGSHVILTQTGETLSVTPSLKDLPEHVRQLQRNLELQGTVTQKDDGDFSLSASHQSTIEPTPNMKLKVSIEFRASGVPSADGLVMKTCEWKAAVVVFSQGEIAGSEEHSEKCVGLWKRS